MRSAGFEARSAEVEAIRRQLDPIRTRRSLAASYQRESINRGDPSSAARPRDSAVRIAYAWRWRELGPDRR